MYRKRTKSKPSPIFVAFMLALFGAVWLLLAPVQFGGQAAYVIVNGNSMEPVYHRGDLVILRAADDYTVGDIVTYRHPDIGPVIHRVIGMDNGRFVFKGDHNTWLDAYHPARDELIGKAWIYVPWAGKLIEQVRVPRNMALLAGGIGVFFMATVTTDDTRRRRRARRLAAPISVRFVVGERAAPPAPARAGDSTPGALAELREFLLIALGVLGFAALLLALLAFTRPVTRTVQEDVGYQQAGVFSYSAAAPQGVYDTDGARSGDTVFVRLSKKVDINFGYHASADQPAQFGGTYRVSAEITDGNGWRRTIALQPDTPFSGGQFSANVSLDLPQIQALVDAFEKQTALAGQQYTLAVVPQVTLRGTLAGQDLQEEFAPRLEFRFDKTRMQFVKTDGADPLQPVKKGLIKSPGSQPNTLTLLGLTLAVATARRLALAGLLLALSGGLALSVALRRMAGADEPGRIQARYGALLLDVRAGALEACGQIIAVASIDDLAKLAEREGRMIFHQSDGGAHHYFVQDNGVTYLYQPAVAAGSAAAPRETEVSDVAPAHLSS